LTPRRAAGTSCFLAGRNVEAASREAGGAEMDGARLIDGPLCSGMWVIAAAGRVGLVPSLREGHQGERREDGPLEWGAKRRRTERRPRGGAGGAGGAPAEVLHLLRLQDEEVKSKTRVNKRRWVTEKKKLRAEVRRALAIVPRPRPRRAIAVPAMVWLSASGLCRNGSAAHPTATRGGRRMREVRVLASTTSPLAPPQKQTF
jgi:hypothetical protein